MLIQSPKSPENTEFISGVDTLSQDASFIAIEQSDFIYTADYSRDGNDLVIAGKNGHVIVVENYFDFPTPPDLKAPEGGILKGEVVELLAGPANPGAYAQATEAGGSSPIGQVETVEGTATVLRTDGTTEPLTVGTKVFQNDVVQTSDGGSLSITFADGTIFTLSSNSRMVLNEMVFAPDGNGNSAVFNLVEGTFVFIAGQVAKTGNMEITTPVATMGIRGTTVKVDIQTINGISTVEVSLNRDPDGGLGQFTIKNLDGEVIANVQTEQSKWLLAADGSSATEVERSDIDLAQDLIVITRAVQAYEAAQDRVINQGETFVEGDDAGEDGSEEEEEQEEEADEETDEETDDDSSDAETETDNDNDADNNNDNNDADGADNQQQGNLNSGPVGSGLSSDQTGTDLDTSLAGNDDGSDFEDTTVSSDLGDDSSTTTETTSDNTQNENTDPPPPSPPSYTLPNPTVTEDSFILITGFSVSDPTGGGSLTVTLTAGSTVALAPGSGVTITDSTGTAPNFDQVTFTGTETQVNDALDGLTYAPSLNDDDGGTLTITASNGVATSTAVMTINITAQPDAPTATPDVVTRGESSSLFFGDLFLNDSDPDTGDTLTVTQVTENTGGNPTLTFGTAHTLASGGNITVEANGLYAFDPNGAYEALKPGQNVVHTLGYDIEDTDSLGDSATLTITVTGENDAPLITGDLALAANEGNAVIVVAADLGEADPDDDGAELTYTVTSGPANGTILVNGVAGSSFTQAQLDANQVQYSHDNSETTADSFSVSLADGGEDGAAPDIKTINVTVTPVNDAPVNTVPGPQSVDEDNSLNIAGIQVNDSDAGAFNISATLSLSGAGTLLLSEVEPGGLTGAGIINNNSGNITLVGTIAQINATLAAATGVTYTPGTNFNGVETLTFESNDNGRSGLGGGMLDTDNIAITVNPINDPLVISGVTDPAPVNEGTSPTLSNEEFILANFFTATDADTTDTPTIDETSIVLTPTANSDTGDHSSIVTFLTGNATKLVTDTANFDFLGQGQLAEFGVTFDVDSGPDTEQVMFTIQVNGLNDAPDVSAVTDPTATTEGDQGTVALETVDLSSLLTFFDRDQTDTAQFDASSITITPQGGSAVQSDLFFNLDGTNLIYDRGLFDFMNNGDQALFDVSFDIVSGTDTVSRTAVITVDGTTDNAINIVNGTAASDGQLNGSAGNDLIFGNGTNANDYGGDELLGGTGSDILVGSDGNELFDGGDGDDTILTGDNNPGQGDVIRGSTGNDRINFGGLNQGFVDLHYAVATAGIVATFNGAANAATVDKGAFGTDTLVDVIKPLEAGVTTGGLRIFGSAAADSFTFDNGANTWSAIGGGDGVDSYNLVSGIIRLEFRNGAEFVEATQEANVNLSLASNQIINDGFGNTETITGAAGVWEVRGTNFNDTLIGSNADESFIGEKGNDIIDGGGGFDRLRFDRSGVASVEVDLENGTATGFWDDSIFSYTVSNIEWVRGSNVGYDDIIGSSANNRLDGRKGVDVLNGRGGDDELIGGGDRDVYVVQTATGSDTIGDLNTSEDLVGLFGFGISSSSGFTSFTFDGQDTIAGLPGGNTLTFEGVDLTSLSTAALDAFLIFNLQEGDANDNTLNGTANNDVLVGDAGDDTLNGLDGNDVLIGGSASDGYPSTGTGNILDGGAGNDILIGGTGFSLLTGGPGDDRLVGSQVVYVNDETSFANGTFVDYSTSTSGITANLSGGAQGGLNPGEVSDGLGGIDTLSGINRVFDSPHDDTFFIDGSDPSSNGARGEDASLSAGNDTVTFLGGNGGRIDYGRAMDGVDANLSTGSASDRNVVDPGDQIGNDIFTGANRLNGSNYDDILTGDGGNNRLRGRAGNDQINGGGGTNTIEHFSTEQRIDVDLSLGSNQVINDGHGGTDTLANIHNVWGNFGADHIIGDSNANQFFGFAGSDLLEGGGGVDELHGDFGNVPRGDGVFVAGGNDTLIGGLGNDYLVGGVGADFFGFNGSDDFDFIEDFNFGDGDRVDVSDFGAFTSTADFHDITFMPGDNWTNVSFDALGNGVTIKNVDLTALSQIDQDARFIFDVIKGDAVSATSLTGTSMDDVFRPIDNANGFYNIAATTGDDIYDFSFAFEGFQSMDYSGFANGVVVNIDGIANTGNIDKGGGQVDTIRNVYNPLYSGFFGTVGGFAVIGSAFADSFVINNPAETWMMIKGGDGVDSYTLQQADGGLVRLDFRDGSTGANVNLSLSSNQIANDGFNNVESISGPGKVWEVRGTDHVDMLTGSAANESFITREGNDTVNGGGSGADMDRIRYDRGGVSGINADLNAGTITGTWNGNAFTDTISDIEWVRGNDNADTFTGTANAERFQGRGGNDILTGGGGADELWGEDGNDRIEVPDTAFKEIAGGSGLDVLAIVGTGKNLDFSGLENISGIEEADLGSNSNTATITEQNVIDASNESNTDIDTALGANAIPDAILVNGDNTDTLRLANSGEIAGGSWALDAVDSATFTGYDVYEYSAGGPALAQVAVDEVVPVTIV